MKRWLILVFIGAVVVSGINGCVFVVADEDIAHEVRAEKQGRSTIARDIQREIERDAQLQFSDVRVREHDGIVTLSGHVEGLHALSRAIEIALDRSGADDLRLELQIGVVN